MHPVVAHVVDDGPSLRLNLEKTSIGSHLSWARCSVPTNIGFDMAGDGAGGERLVLLRLGIMTLIYFALRGHLPVEVHRI